MLPYTSKLRTSTVVVRAFLSLMGLSLIIIGVLATVGIALSGKPETVALIFAIVCVTTGVLILRVSAWNIRQYVINQDNLEVRILGGIKKIVYPVSSLNAFNDLKVLVLNESTGIGIFTKEGKMIKVLELEYIDFPDFVHHLQLLIPWDHNLTIKNAAGNAS